MDAQFMRQFSNALYQYCYQDKIAAKTRIDELLKNLKSLQMTDYYHAFKNNFIEVDQQFYQH